MSWKTKALVQNMVARLPSRLSYHSYYWLQRRFGALRRVNPVSTLRAAVELREHLEQHQQTVRGKVCLEVGTGRRLNLPLAMWLFGAGRIVTVDLNRYLKLELVAQDLDYMRAHQDEICSLLDHADLDKDRLHRLLEFDIDALGLDKLLKTCNIEYLAPADASQLPLADDCVDFHVSVNVFEHVPRQQLVAIANEAARVVKDDGLLIHRIDHSDHFSHTDKTISRINFLRYGNLAWSLLAGNRYMYMNRLRVDDFLELFQGTDHEILSVAAKVDDGVVRDVQSDRIPIHRRFRDKTIEDLACMTSIFVLRPRPSTIRNATVAAA